MAVSPNRLVVVLTPLVFAPLAGTISAFAAEHIPGLQIDRDQIQQVFIAGALIAFGKAALWLKGWQDWEKQQAGGDGVADDLAIETAAPGAAGDDDPAFAGAFDPDADEDVDEEDGADGAGDLDPDLELAAPGAE